MNVAFDDVVKAHILEQLSAELLENLMYVAFAVSFPHQTLIQRQLTHSFKYLLPANVCLQQDFFWVISYDSLNLTDDV